MKSREGYTRVPASWGSAVPPEVKGDVNKESFACSLCPDDKECTGSVQCDAGTGMVWVPDHVYLVWRLHAKPEQLRHYEWAVEKYPVTLPSPSPSSNR